MREESRGKVGRKIIVWLMAVGAAGGQAPKAATPRYEVASVKATSDGDPRTAFRFEPDGAMVVEGLTLRRLMMTAYSVQGFRIAGGPDWVGSIRWEIHAKPDRAARPEQFRAMLRGLLEERFGLRVHSEVRRLPVYRLVVERKGGRVPAAKEAGAKPVVEARPGAIRLTNAAPGTFAGQLSYALGRPVIDETKLSGRFDFALQWTPEPGEDGGPATTGAPPDGGERPASAFDGPSIFTAIREQLGLRLRAGRGPVEMMVIDGVEMAAAN